MKKLTLACAALALMATTAMAEEKKKEAPQPAPEGAVMVVPINPPLTLRFTDSMDCEAERERIKDTLKVVCIRFK
jgi:hypothetical protein